MYKICGFTAQPNFWRVANGCEELLFAIVGTEHAYVCGFCREIFTVKGFNGTNSTAAINHTNPKRIARSKIMKTHISEIKIWFAIKQTFLVASKFLNCFFAVI